MKKLFHISEENNIEKFIPRKSKEIWQYRKYVWAISEDKIQNYLLPRNCPRICLKANILMKIKGCLEELELKQYENIIIAPENWKSEIRNCILYRYEFNTKNFNVIDKIAGYYISEEIEIPIDIVSLNNCNKEIEKTNTKLVLLTEESMMKIKSYVMENTNEFSIIRWSNMKK